MKDKFYSYIKNLQDKITKEFEIIDGSKSFQEDIWRRDEGGGGRTRILQNGKVFEKGGVNISKVYGHLPKSMQAYFKVSDVDFFACGLSLVIHPKNPMVPTVHANWRYFEMYDSNGEILDQWFGGGLDLTPFYIFNDDVKHFHAVCKSVCKQHDESYYAKFKKNCDEYFYNSHRGESRGVGGLFFDYCRPSKQITINKWFEFITDVADSFLEAYTPIVKKRKDIPYGAKERNWQEIRRGRYVEFNLVHDKGTLFGLKTNGRIESILMSLPPFVQWKYNYTPEPNSKEEELINILKHPKNWV